MALQKVFVNQTTNATVLTTAAYDSLTQIEIAGTLGTATVTTSIQSNFNPAVFIPVADATWTPSDTPAFNGHDGAVILLKSSVLQFTITNAGGGTNISVSVV